MDKIYEAAAKYVALSRYEYKFILSRNRKLLELRVDFRDEDFYHLTGLQYLKDIDIPRNRKKTLDDIIYKKRITDSRLENSRFYVNPVPDKDIQSRINSLRFLEEYIDTDNIIRVFSTRNQPHMASLINADYIIESQFKGDSDTVYIFLKHREENPEYCCVVSFFKKDKAVYGGDILYWMQKTKVFGDNLTVLYQHKDYNA